MPLLTDVAHVGVIANFPPPQAIAAQVLDPKAQYWNGPEMSGCVLPTADAQRAFADLAAQMAEDSFVEEVHDCENDCAILRWDLADGTSLLAAADAGGSDLAQHLFWSHPIVEAHCTSAARNHNTLLSASHADYETLCTTASPFVQRVLTQLPQEHAR